MSANREDKDWEGIPCVLPDWIYTANLTIFEARQAIKRQNANYFADVVGIDASESEEAEILKMIRAARDAANAARTVEHELVIEVRARGISLKKIGDVLGLKEAGVGMYLSRAPLTAERQEEISRELQAWVLLTKLWARDVESDEPGESFFLHGVNQLLFAQQHFEQCVQLQMTGRNPAAAIQKLRSAHGSAPASGQGAKADG
jgi:predicted transcriptional regulator